MFKIVVVDDNIDDSELLVKYLKQYFSDKNKEIVLKIYNDGCKFLEEFTLDLDLIFLDVEMPLFNGIDIAKEVRFKDENVCIVFISNFARYAVKGYEVSAFDYFVKPLIYEQFAFKMDRICGKISSAGNGKAIFLKTDDGVKRIYSIDISYVEVMDHYLYYHVRNVIYRVRQSMKSAEESLNGQPFIRCNSCFLVNMNYVKSFNGKKLVVGDESIPMSRARKGECLQKLADFFCMR